MSKAISVSAGQIFTIFSPNRRYLREFSRSGPVFPIPQGTLLSTDFVLYRTCLLDAEVLSQDPLDRFSQSLNIMVGIELQMIYLTFFFRYLKGRCHGNQLVEIWHFLWTNLFVAFRN